MLKEKKLEFQQTLEEYLEQQKLYEVFESLMKSLITERPEDPIEHLIKKLEQPESKHSNVACNGYSVENCAD